MPDIPAIAIVAVSVILLLAGVAWLQSRTNKQLAAIHKLVNARLTAALDRAEEGEREIERLGGDKAPPPRVRRKDEA